MASEKTQPPEQGTATSAAVELDGGMSVADFLTWEPADDLRYQLINGVPVAMALAGPTHATMSRANAVETWTSVWAYTTLALVREILVLQTDAIAAHLLRRNEDGPWPPAPTPLGKDLELQSMGFTAPLLSAYRNTRLARQGDP